MREKETTSGGGKLAPCQHNIGVLLTEERHRLKESRAEQICLDEADTAVK